jgi:16S rRNA (guanine527-N7)-methyltransferase
VDNAALEQALIEGAGALGIKVDSRSAKRLIQYQEELLRWNLRINLIGRASVAREVMEKHLLDSLAVVPEISSAATLIDIGAGAGLPGIPLKVLRPTMDVTLVESIGKKAAFMRHAILELELGSGIRVRQARAQGNPAAEQLPVTEASISRAVSALPEWLGLALSYVAPGGHVIAMLSHAEDAAVATTAAQAGATLLSVRRFELPFSRAPRAVAVFRRSGGRG